MTCVTKLCCVTHMDLNYLSNLYAVLWEHIKCVCEQRNPIWDFSQRKGSVYEHTGQLTDINEQLHLNRPTISMLMWWFFSARRLWHFGNVACAAPENRGSNEVGIMAPSGDHVWLAPYQHLDGQFTACTASTSAASGRAWAPRQPGHRAAATELCGVAGDPANPSPCVMSSPRLHAELLRTLQGPWCEVR